MKTLDEINIEGAKLHATVGFGTPRYDVLEALYKFYLAVCDVAQRDTVTPDQGRALEEAGIAVQALIGAPEGCREWGRPE